MKGWVGLVTKTEKTFLVRGRGPRSWLICLMLQQQWQPTQSGTGPGQQLRSRQARWITTHSGVVSRSRCMSRRRAELWTCVESASRGSTRDKSTTRRKHAHTVRRNNELRKCEMAATSAGEVARCRRKLIEGTSETRCRVNQCWSQWWMLRDRSS